MIGDQNQYQLKVILLTCILLDNYVVHTLPNNNDCDNNILKHSSNNNKDGDVNDNMKYNLDEFYIEHEISALDARFAANKLHPENMETPSGCKPCTDTELRYCLGPSLMNDHCCCDRRFQEMFNHIPHTCYIGQRLCRTIARDCGEYTRLRACCCDQQVALKWKALSNATNYVPISLLVMMSLLTLML